MASELETAQVDTSVNFNVDVNKILEQVLQRSSRNDLMVLTKNGMLSAAEVLFSIDPGGHGDLAEVKGSQDISPVTRGQASQTAQYCAVGIHAVNAGSNVLLRIPVGNFVLNMIAATPVNKENYIKYSVTEKLHGPKAMRDRVDKTDKLYANEGVVKVKIHDKVAWITITNVSPAVCTVELREASGVTYS